MCLHIYEWYKIKGGAYKGKHRVFKDLLLTLSSIGAHNAYTTSSTTGLQEKMKWYRKLWAPQNPFLKKKEDSGSGDEVEETYVDVNFDSPDMQFVDGPIIENEK